ncbi:hypothetical protein ACH5RR_023377 [Cinchona calisaya]|uniref:Uncharacterized protein n=1 Tax=Cinchona calisaya TaxID=153742 RepID=A0ABD2ZDS1_9GENT
MVRSKTSLKKGDQNAQRGRMPISLREYFSKGFLMEDQIENVNMMSSIEIEGKDVTKEVEGLAKPTKDNGSSVELDLSSLESIIHSLFKLLQKAMRLLVDVLQECDGNDSTFEEPIPKSSCPKSCAHLTSKSDVAIHSSHEHKSTKRSSSQNHSSVPYETRKGDTLDTSIKTLNDARETINKDSNKETEAILTQNSKGNLTEREVNAPNEEQPSKAVVAVSVNGKKTPLVIFSPQALNAIIGDSSCHNICDKEESSESTSGRDRPWNRPKKGNKRNTETWIWLSSIQKHSFEQILKTFLEHMSSLNKHATRFLEEMGSKTDISALQGLIKTFFENIETYNSVKASLDGKMTQESYEGLLSTTQQNLSTIEMQEQE